MSRFYFDSHGVDDEAVGLGWAWLLQEAAGSEGRVGWVAVNSIDTATRLGRGIGGVAGGLARARSVTVGAITIGLITQTRANNPRWTTGPLLAVWPSRELLERVEDELMPPQLCVIPWARGDLDYWIAGRAPIEMRSGATAEAPSISNPVVAVAMDTLTTLCSFAVERASIADFRERSTAIEVFKALQRGGEHYDPAEIVQWAAANGWELADARELGQIADQIRQGRRLRSTAGRRLREDALDQWRVAANG